MLLPPRTQTDALLPSRERTGGFELGGFRRMSVGSLPTFSILFVGRFFRPLSFYCWSVCHFGAQSWAIRLWFRTCPPVSFPTFILSFLFLDETIFDTRMRDKFTLRRLIVTNIIGYRGRRMVKVFFFSRR